MGIDPLSLTLIGGTILSAGASVVGGIQAKKAGDAQKAQADIDARRREEQAAEEAELEAEEASRFRKKQKMKYLKSGVMLAGSPLLVLEETTERSNKNVSAIRGMGASQAERMRRQGRIAQRSGRSALVAGIGEGIGTLSSLSKPRAKVVRKPVPKRPRG